MKQIIPVFYGIASSYDDSIEINKHLDNYPQLKEKILEHELRHNSGKYTKQDFKNDFQSKEPYFFETIKFCLKYPEAWINYFFLMYSYKRKTFTYNLTSLFPIIYYGFLFSAFFSLLFSINLVLTFFSWLVIYVSLNIVLLILTHLLVKKYNKN